MFYCSRFYRAPVCLDLFMPVAPITGTSASDRSTNEWVELGALTQYALAMLLYASTEQLGVH